MKKLMVTMLICGLALPSMAYLGLPFAEDANTHEGLARITGSVTLESDVNLYGGRFTYGLADGLAVFGGVGIFDPDYGDTEPYFQGGGLYTLPVDAPVDLALRGAAGYTSYGRSVDLWTINGGLLASKELDEQFSLYGFGGLSYWDISNGYGDDGVEPAVAAGVLFFLNRQVSLFGELAHIDELFISVGATFDL